MLPYPRIKAVIADEHKSVPLSADPKDNPILAIALNGGQNTPSYATSPMCWHWVRLGVCAFWQENS